MMENFPDELFRIKATLKKHPEGLSVTQIARALNKNKNTVGRYLDILLISGHVTVRNYGKARVFTLSRRVPLSALLSCSNEMIMVIDADQRIVEINDNFLALLQSTRSEIIGKNCAFVVSPLIDLQELLEALASGRNDPARIILSPGPEGEPAIYRSRHLPIVFDDGTPGETVILENITMQVMAEQAQRESEERFRIMAENVSEGILIVENERIVYGNQHIADILGYEPAEIPAIDPAHIAASHDLTRIREIAQEVATKKSPSDEVRFRITKKGGRRQFVCMHVAAAWGEDQFCAFLTVQPCAGHSKTRRSLKAGNRHSVCR